MEQESRLCDKIFFGVVIAFIFSCAMYAMAQAPLTTERYIEGELKSEVHSRCAKYKKEERFMRCMKRVKKEFYDKMDNKNVEYK